MFENGQTIMLMGSAETTDVATHLDPSKLESTTSTSVTTKETESVKLKNNSFILILVRCLFRPA